MTAQRKKPNASWSSSTTAWWIAPSVGHRCQPRAEPVGERRAGACACAAARRPRHPGRAAASAAGGGPAAGGRGGPRGPRAGTWTEGRSRSGPRRGDRRACRTSARGRRARSDRPAVSPGVHSATPAVAPRRAGLGRSPSAARCARARGWRSRIACSSSASTATQRELVAAVAGGQVVGRDACAARGRHGAGPRRRRGGRGPR